MQAITEKPRLDKLELAKRSASVFPTANSVQESRVLFRSRLTDKNLITSTITPAEYPSHAMDPSKAKGVKTQLNASVLPSFCSK